MPVSIRRLIGYTLTEPWIRRIACPESTSACNCPVAAAWAMTKHGPLDGTPAFYFHGSPSTRLEWNLFTNESLAARLNVRVIAPDRPASAVQIFNPGVGSPIGLQMWSRSPIDSNFQASAFWLIPVADHMPSLAR